MAQLNCHPLGRMKKMKYQVFILALCICSCTTSYNVVPDVPIKRTHAITYRQIQEKIGIEQVEIITKDRSSYVASDVRIIPDSIYFVNASNKRNMALPLFSIYGIVRTLYTDGAIRGLVYGSFLGAIAGGLVGALVRDPEAEMSGLVVLVYGIGGVFTGAGLGTTYGAVHGQVIEYRFLQDSVSNKLYTP
jgi:hypothetical protein